VDLFFKGAETAAMKIGMSGIPVARRGELPPGETKKFYLRCDGREIEAFVVNYEGMLYAYVNQCRHIPMTMDWIENQFLSEDGRHVQCATHGALYDPASGECVAGPPLGQCLTPIPLATRGEEIVADCPGEPGEPQPA
jgi:nitrite reductase/ring-hydroxylating ferredoxin subunit